MNDKLKQGVKLAVARYRSLLAEFKDVREKRLELHKLKTGAVCDLAAIEILEKEFANKDD